MASFCRFTVHQVSSRSCALKARPWVLVSLWLWCEVADEAIVEEESELLWNVRVSPKPSLGRGAEMTMRFGPPSETEERLRTDREGADA
jgi:hypothetical protein